MSRPPPCGPPAARPADCAARRWRGPPASGGGGLEDSLAAPQLDPLERV